jgi:hypothetical protein
MSSKSPDVSILFAFIVNYDFEIHYKSFTSMAFKAMTARPRVFVFEMEVKFYV